MMDVSEVPQFLVVHRAHGQETAHCLVHRSNIHLKGCVGQFGFTSTILGQYIPQPGDTFESLEVLNRTVKWPTARLQLLKDHQHSRLIPQACTQGFGRLIYIALNFWIEQRGDEEVLKCIDPRIGMAKALSDRTLRRESKRYERRNRRRNRRGSYRASSGD